MLGDPKPSLVMNAANAMGRAKDDVILGAFFATAKTGELAATFDHLRHHADDRRRPERLGFQGASAATNLTVAKLREVVKTFLQNNVDLDREQITGALNAKAHDSLLGEIQVTSMDYQTKPVLEEGRIRRFMGINFVLTEEVTTSAPAPTIFRHLDRHSVLGQFRHASRRLVGIRPPTSPSAPISSSSPGRSTWT
jgi:hypothetical protein